MKKLNIEELYLETPDINDLKNTFGRTRKRVMQYCEDYSVKDNNGTEAMEIFSLFVEEVRAREKEIDKLIKIIDNLIK